MRDLDRSSMRIYYSLVIAFCVLSPLSFFVLTQTTSESNLVASEYGIVENIGALMFLFSSIAFLYLFLNSKKVENKFFFIKTNRNIYFLLLVIFFFLCFGEEISWGQHLIGWETPEAWRSANAQDETNIHNLWIFQAYREDMSVKGFWERMFNFNRLFSLFWLSYCVIVPIADRLSDVLSRLMKGFGLPIPPLNVGLLFVLTFAVYKLVTSYADEWQIFSLDEIKEMYYAIAFAMMAIYFLIRSRSSAGSLNRRQA